MNFSVIKRNAFSLRSKYALSVFFTLSFAAGNVLAANPSEVKNLSEKTVDVGISAQQTHESWVDEEHRLLEEIEDIKHSLEHVKWQRKKMQVYQQGITEKISNLEKKAAAMEAVNLELLPILEKNLASLKEELDNDIPANMSERRKSLIHAQTVLNDYDMGLLDKTRAVLDAIAREVDFGHHVNVVEDEIQIDGEGRRVKMLQVGRTGLYAMTLDSEKAFQWDKKNSSWVPVEKDVTGIQEAIEIAEGIRLVGLSSLPVDSPVLLSVQEEKVQ